MKSILTISILLFAMVASASGQATTFRDLTRNHQHPNNPISVTVGTSGQTLSLIGRDARMLYFRDRSGGSIGQPITGIRNLTFVPTSAVQRGLENFQGGNFEATVREMRTFADQLVPYLDLPESNAPELMVTYLIALRESGQFDRAIEILRIVPLDGENNRFVPQIFSLSNRLRVAGVDFMPLIERVPLSPDNTAYVPFMQQFAELLLENDLIAEASRIYRRVRDNTSGAERRWATLWMAYSEVRDQQLLRTREILNEVGDLEISEPTYSLFHLIESRLAWADRNYEDALDSISRGIAYANINTSWFPEMLYLSAQAYRLTGNDETATNVEDYLKMLFPENYWTKRLDREGS